jgi:hypothetical protein
MEKREVRRHHSRRMKAKARHVALYDWGYAFSYRDRPDELEKFLNRAEKWADHLKMCSCYGCCNQRSKKSWDSSITRQEFEAYLSYLEQVGYSDAVEHCRYGKKCNYYADRSSYEAIAGTSEGGQGTDWPRVE